MTKFLNHLKEKHPKLHAKVQAHPDFNDQIDSLKALMALNPDDGPALTEDECSDVLDGIFGAADKHGSEHAQSLMFGDDAGSKRKVA